MTDPAVKENQENRVSYLDGIRGLAAAIVSLPIHYKHFSSSYQPASLPENTAPWYDLFYPFYRLGSLGVDVFFILSGIVFSIVYLREISGARFFLLRFSRLYPIHLFTLLLSASLSWGFYAYQGRFPIYKDNDLFQFVLNLLFLQCGLINSTYSFNGPSWSISVEAVLYFLFFYTTRTRWHIFLWLAGLITGLLTLHFGLNLRAFFNPDMARGLVGFFFGMLLYRYALARAPSVTFLLIYASLIVLISFTGNLTQIWRGLSLSWLVTGAVIMIAHHVRLAQWALSLRPLTLLGDLSLAIYMIHAPIQMAILLMLAWLGWAIPYSEPWFLLAYFLLVLGASYVLHRVLELPAQSWLRKRGSRFSP